jgi:hypothetical protein
MGVYKWLTDDRKSAFKLWHEAVTEGSSIGARPQLSRTFAEMGLRPYPVNRELPDADVSTAAEYLHQAEAMFRDMELHHDLENLNSKVHRET